MIAAVTPAVMEAFRAAAPERFRDESDEALGAALAPVMARALAAWPDVAVPPEAFARHLAERLGDEPTVAEALAALDTDDLYIACGCVLLVPMALPTFHRSLQSYVDRALARFRIDEAAREDLRQDLREAFFVKKTLAKYSGRGHLRGWLRSAATRAALNALAARKPGGAEQDDALLARLPALGNVELDLLRRRMREAFRTAFDRAFASLSDADRTLLALHYIDGASVDALARHYGVHRATAARRVAAVRQTLLERTLVELREGMHVDAGELESLMRAASSELDASLYRKLKDAR
jgi:RNA polymerase sigma-70 factor (ECF subfamily)